MKHGLPILHHEFERLLSSYRTAAKDNVWKQIVLENPFGHDGSRCTTASIERSRFVGQARVVPIALGMTHQKKTSSHSVAIDRGTERDLADHSIQEPVARAGDSKEAAAVLVQIQLERFHNRVAFRRAASYRTALRQAELGQPSGLAESAGQVVQAELAAQ